MAVAERTDRVGRSHPTQPEVLAACAEGLAEGRLLLPYCSSCGTFLYQWFNRCSAHWSEPVEVREATGEGTVWSWVRYHRQYRLPGNQQAPYAVLCIDLDQGPRIYANLADDGEVTPRRGLRVRLDGNLTVAKGHLVFGAVAS